MAIRTRTAVVVPVKGLDVGKPGEFIDPRSTPDCSDVQISRLVIEKRQGSEAVGSSLTERVLALPELERGGVTYLLRIGPTKVQQLNKTTVVWTSIANAALTGTEDDRIDYAFPQLSGSKIIVFTNNTVNNIRKYTGAGTDADLGGSPPKCKFVLDFGSYLILGWVLDSGNQYYARVQWCDTGAPETWTGGNAGSQDLLEDPGELTGFGRPGDYFTVHKADSIYVGYLVSTSNVFKFDRKATGAGTICFATIQDLPTGEEIFLAKDGLRLFNGTTAPLVPSTINDEIRETMNPEEVGKCWSKIVKERQEYWVGIPIGSQTEPDTVYKYNYVTGQAYKDTRPDITAVGLYKNTQGQLSWNDKTNPWDSDPGRWNDVVNLTQNDIVIFGDSAGVTTKRSSITNDDNGEVIRSYWTGKDITAVDVTGDPNDEGKIVEWQGLQVWALGQSLDIAYSINGGRSWITLETLTLGSEYPEDSAPLMVWFEAVSSQIRFRFLNEQSEETWKLKKFVILSVFRGEEL